MKLYTPISQVNCSIIGPHCHISLTSKTCTDINRAVEKIILIKDNFMNFGKNL